MTKKTLLIPLVLFLLFSAPALSYSGFLDNEVGTMGAQFLRICPGARPAAMGGAFTAVTDDANAVSYNPACLAFMPHKQITFTHNEWLQGIRYEYLALSYPLYDSMAIGGSFFLLNSGEISYRDNTGAIVEGGAYAASNMAATISYSQKLSGRMSVGISGRIIQMVIEEESAQAYQADVGLLIRPAQSINLGISLTNIGQDIKFINEADPSPMSLKSGFAISSMNGSLTIAGDINFITLDTFVFNAGSEFRMENMSFRGGYQMVPSMTDLSRFSVGGGLLIDNVSIDYGWLMYGELGSSHRFSLSVKF